MTATLLQREIERHRAMQARFPTIDFRDLDFYELYKLVGHLEEFATLAARLGDWHCRPGPLASSFTSAGYVFDALSTWARKNADALHIDLLNRTLPESTDDRELLAAALLEGAVHRGDTPAVIADLARSLA